MTGCISLMGKKDIFIFLLGAGVLYKLSKSMIFNQVYIELLFVNYIFNIFNLCITRAYDIPP